MKCFEPVTDKLLYDSPASCSVPLVPYVPGMRCVHQERKQAGKRETQARDRSHED